MVRRWLLISVVVVLLVGTILSLPAFWARPVVGEKASQVAHHWLDCLFTTASALTDTGLTPHDIGDDFSLAGQAAILALMQVGGLAVLVAGSIVGWRFRRRFGWGTGHEDTSRSGLTRLIAFVCVLTLVFEAAGAAAIYYSLDRGPNGPARPMFTAVFHSVSAFCNVGFLLTRDSLVSQSASWPPYAVFLPLMVLGSIGGPALYELWRRWVRSLTARTRLSRDARVALIGTAGLVLVGAALIFFTESTPRWQLRNPRENTPGRLMVTEESAGEQIVFSADSSTAKNQRLRTMGVGQRAAAALFQSAASRTAGFRVARLDEKSISPADRAIMMVLMLVGGGLGGTAGGMRITVVAVLLGAIFGGRRGGVLAEREQDARAGAVRAAAAAATAMMVLVVFSTLVLIYREVGSVEECAFEALSACTNTGFTAGLTRLLSPEGQVMVILAMLLGRIIPLAMLANYLQPTLAENTAWSPAIELREPPARS